MNDIDYSQSIDGVYENLEDYSPTKKGKMFDDIIAVKKSYKKLKQIVAELFMRGRKHNISLAFVSQSYFRVPKGLRLNMTILSHKYLNKREFQQIASNHSSDIVFKDFMKLYKDYTKQSFLFLVNNRTLPSDNP